MIETITIADIASFPHEPSVMSALTRFNYVFGANGTGKTTISRVIADASKCSTCEVSWRGGTSLHAVVYNRDFVDRNFNQSEVLKGVFTLGEERVDTLSKIKSANLQLQRLDETIGNLTQALQGGDGTGGKQADLAALNTTLKEKVWSIKVRLDDNDAQFAFRGYLNSKESFTRKILEELDSNDAKLVGFDELERKAKLIFVDSPETESSIPATNTRKLAAHEINPILKKRVVGKADVDIAAMIKKLGNSDWVRAGRSFYEANDGYCPFCQQVTTKALAESLKEYFDESFDRDNKAINELVSSYATHGAQLQQELATVIASPSRFLDVKALRLLSELCDARLKLNTDRLAGKVSQPSQVVELESLNNVFTDIQKVIASANAAIEKHNQMIANLKAERAELIAQIWRFALDELKDDLDNFTTERDKLEKAISHLTSTLQSTRSARSQKAVEIGELEKQTISIQPTIDSINRILGRFGFLNFTLARAEAGECYTLVRRDGSDAKDTLSEGEKNFVTFLLLLPPSEWQ